MSDATMRPTPPRGEFYLVEDRSYRTLPGAPTNEERAADEARWVRLSRRPSFRLAQWWHGIRSRLADMIDPRDRREDGYW